MHGVLLENNDRVGLLGAVGRENAAEYPADPFQDIPLIGNGDCYSYMDFQAHRDQGVATVLIARGALIKPWCAW